MPEATEVLEWRGRTAVATDGSKLGTIEEIYLDAQTQRPEWALIQTGMFGGKSSFMPLEGATSDGDDVRAPYTKEQVKDAPQMDPDGELSQQRRVRAVLALRDRLRRVALGQRAARGRAAIERTATSRARSATTPAARPPMTR